MELILFVSLGVIFFGILAGIFMPGGWILIMTAIYVSGMFYMNNYSYPGWSQKEHVTLAVGMSLIFLFMAAMLTTKLFRMPKKKKTEDEK